MTPQEIFNSRVREAICLLRQAEEMAWDRRLDAPTVGTVEWNGVMNTLHAVCDYAAEQRVTALAVV